MTWQDITLSAISVLLNFTFLPAVIHRKHLPTITTWASALGLSVYAGVYFDLGLWFAGVTTAIGATLWFVLIWRIRCD